MTTHRESIHLWLILHQAHQARLAFRPREPFASDDEDPLLRQLELADEFRQIGDTEGAREVLQELIGKASGPLRDKAQALLNELR